jgi:serine/threonine-protein kinase
MLEATAAMPEREFGQAPDIEFVTLRVDTTRGCLANPYTLPQDVDVLQFPKGTEPEYEVCKQPSSYSELSVPSVIGLDRDDAVSRLHAAGFNVSVRIVASDQPEGTVVAQDPQAGSRLIQTGTVTISVARGGPPESELVTVPNVVGRTQGAATAALTNAGFTVVISFEPTCDPNDDGCDYRPGIVWDQSPGGGAQVEPGSTVNLTVNP